MKLPSPAKLNLFLHITGQREDGYHELQTLFQFIDLCDTLTFTLTKNQRITIQPEIPNLALEDNLIYKAAQLLLPHKKNPQLGIDILLKKQLPMGGGIGGGSSNAATTLLALNTLWECKLTLEELATLGLQLGADIPVFVMGFSCFAEGIGEQLQQVNLDESCYLLVYPNCHVPTVQIFTDKHLTRDTPPIKISHALKLGGHNDCLNVVRKLHSEVDEAYIWLNQHGDAKLTGTGACLFLKCKNLQHAEKIQSLMPSKWQSWTCQSCNVSPTHTVLNQWIELHEI